MGHRNCPLHVHIKRPPALPRQDDDQYHSRMLQEGWTKSAMHRSPHLYSVRLAALMLSPMYVPTYSRFPIGRMHGYVAKMQV